MPAGGPYHGQTLWLIVGLLTLSSPILITLLERWVREPERGEGGREGGREEEYESLEIESPREDEGTVGRKKNGFSGFSIVPLEEDEM